METSHLCKEISASYLQTYNLTFDMKIIDGFRLRDVMGQATVIGEGVDQVNFSKLITLNSSAAFLWREVEGKEFEVETLAGLLMEEYGIDEDLATHDAKAIAEKWVETGLVK